MPHEGIRAYIKPATIDRYSRLVPVRMGQSVDDYFNEFMSHLEAGNVAIQIQERRKK